MTFAITALTFGAFWLGTQQGARADQVPTCGSQVVTTGGDAAHRASLRR